MKSALVLGLLVLVPIAASAESEYAACMRLEQRMGGAGGAFLPLRNDGNYRAPVAYGGYGGSFPFGGVHPDAQYYSYGVSYAGVYSTVVGRYFGSGASRWSFAQNERVLSMARSCRHLIKLKPPAYRVVGVKSPANRTATNVSGRQATPRAAPRGVLTPGY
jgi:hypothetical protein